MQHKHESSEREQVQQHREQEFNSAIRRGLRYKARNMYDSLLDTCKTLEGVEDDDEKTARGLPNVPTGLMTVDFNNDKSWRKNMTSQTTQKISYDESTWNKTVDSDDTDFTKVSDDRTTLVQSPAKSLQITHRHDEPDPFVQSRIHMM